MTLTMLDKHAETSTKAPWPAEIAVQFEHERKNPNPCVGSELLSEDDRVRVWMIRLQPGERIGFHRHVLDYFWTSVTGGVGFVAGLARGIRILHRSAVVDVLASTSAAHRRPEIVEHMAVKADALAGR